MAKLTKELKDVSKLMHSPDISELLEEFSVKPRPANERWDPYLITEAPTFEKSAQA